MNLSPIQLLDYHVTAISVEACASFQNDKPMDLDPADLEVASQVVQVEGRDDARWACSLVLRHEPKDGKNIPYRLSIELIGLVSAVGRSDIDPQLIHAVEVNGPSMLYGAAREILREATARGPHGPIFIPSASFFTPPPAAIAAEVKKPQPPKRKGSIQKS